MPGIPISQKTPKIARKDLFCSDIASKTKRFRQTCNINENLKLCTTSTISCFQPKGEPLKNWLPGVAD
jgi:hypothetical protein